MKKGKKQRRRLSAATAIMWRITAVVLGLWLVAMCYLTTIVAQDQYERYVEDLDRSARSREDFSDWHEYDIEAEEYTNALDYRSIIRYVMSRGYTHYPELSRPFSDDYLFLDMFDSWYNMHNDLINQSEDWAIVVLDKSGEVLMGQDGYVYMTYYDEQTWFGLLDEYPHHYAKINLNRTECGKAMIEKFCGEDWNRYMKDVRLTGFLDGDEFVLVDAAEIDYDQGYEHLTEYNSTHMNHYDDLGEFDYAVGLPWNDLYDGEVPSDRELMNIYLDEYCIVDSGSVRVKDQTWTLPELAAEYGRNPVLSELYYSSSAEVFENEIRTENYDEKMVREEVERYAKDSLWESVIVQSNIYLDEEGNICTYVMALRCEPMNIAMLMLAEVYVISLLPLVLLLFLINRRLKEDLINPLKHVKKYAGKNYQALPDTVESGWKEIYELEQEYIRTQQTIHDYKKEITQLNTALDYARNAEDNRKRMISNITHELKTPLAVIHSYAEGLKEGIAAEKRDRYLEVILEEAERMDGMVLEMLDLSRLEAGKVKLSSDRFSLLKLTKSVFEKLNPLVEEKALEIEYIYPQEFEITADEGRITQVVTNFVTNAIKYSPEGGKIYISIQRQKDRTSFTIGNQCEPLPQEALEKIWDSFYRTSASRTEKGTGLGLTITKAIVELHGGSCQARNTSNGVEFVFEIP